MIGHDVIANFITNLHENSGFSGHQEAKTIRHNPK